MTERPPCETYRELQREYLEEVPRAFAELRSLVESFRQGRPVLRALELGFHRLAGSGGSYGYPEISEIARQAEQFAATEPGPEHAGRLEEAVRQMEEVRERLVGGE